MDSGLRIEMTSKHQEMAEWYRRAQEEILDSMDEELEMELEDRSVDEITGVTSTTTSEADRRSRKVKLSAQGEALWLQLQDPIHQFYDAALKDLSFDDRLAFIHYFKKLQTNMSKL